MKIKCPACSKVLRIPETAAGKVVKCPCGKQLRVPVGSTGGSPPSNAPPTSRPSATDPFGDNAEIFDELTANDLQPVKSVSSPYAAPPRQAAENDAMQGYAPPSSAGGGFGSAGGRLATVAQRIGGALIDSFLTIGLGMIGAIVGYILGGTINSQDPEVPLAIAQLGFYAGAMLMAIINAILISQSGQSIGKKIAKTRIVDRESGAQVGFFQGVLLRNFVFGIITAIPCVGSIIGLVDLVLLFPEPHETLHDKLAKTMVVQA